MPAGRREKLDTDRCAVKEKSVAIVVSWIQELMTEIATSQELENWESVRRADFKGRENVPTMVFYVG